MSGSSVDHLNVVRAVTADYKLATDLVASGNALTLTITPGANEYVVVHSVNVSGTTTGGAGGEDVRITDGGVRVWESTFTAGTIGQPSQDGLPIRNITRGNVVTVTASATSLTAGTLAVLYSLLPAAV